MKYEHRKDVILEKVDGIYVLAALRPAWKDCPLAMQIIPVYAEIWNGLNEKEENDIILELQKSHGFSREKAELVFSRFIEAAMKYNYVFVKE